MVEKNGLSMAVVAGCLPSKPVDRLVAGSVDDPSTGIRRHTGDRPPLQGHDEGLLDGLFGEIDIAEQPDQSGYDAAELAPEGLLDY
jgi:hypothetical protein